MMDEYQNLSPEMLLNSALGEFQHLKKEILGGLPPSQTNAVKLGPLAAEFFIGDIALFYVGI